MHQDTKAEKVTTEARVASVLRPVENPGLIYLHLRAQDKTLQAIISDSAVTKEIWELALALTAESIIRITGYVGQHLDDSGQVNGHAAATAIHVSDLDVIAFAARDLPSYSCHRQQDLDQRLNNRILDVRYAASGAIFRLHSGMCQLVVEFLCSKDFHWLHTPRIISATIPGDNEYFRLPYFGKDAWLAQSSQHHKQMALSMDMQRVFEIGPVFRAEAKSRDSSRHVTEVTHSILSCLSVCSHHVAVHRPRYSHDVPE